MIFVIAYLIVGCLLVIYARSSAIKKGGYKNFVSNMSCSESSMLIAALIFWLPMLSIALIVKVVKLCQN